MAKEYVTEESFELLEQAQADISVIFDWLNKEEISEKIRHGRACYHITQAVEKMLKGYLKENNIPVKKTHNINVLLDAAKKINKSFDKILRDCAYLNEYTSAMRYSAKNEINRDEVKDAVKRLKNVYEFNEIKILYDKFSTKNLLKKLPNDYFCKEAN